MKLPVMYQVRIEVLERQIGVWRLERVHRMRHRKGRVHAHAGGVQVSCSAVIESVDASRSWGVVAWGLVGEGGKAERVWVHQRRRESPCVMQALGCSIMIFAVVKVAKVSGEVISGVFIVFAIMFGALIERHHGRCVTTRVGVEQQTKVMYI